MKFCDKIIEYSFYTLFFFVPLIFAGNTSELFELNKMWVTFILTIIITTAWLTKMVLQRKIFVQRTPLDIPLLLFLISQIISTLFSLDSYVSWWGYYSRFNGGLFSTVCYILLYYSFVSNLQVKHVLKTLTVTLISGIIVSLWGLPSHFGADPTCFVFRGSFDTACWTDAFRPTIRVFSTLGQPAWFAAYLAVLIPLAMVYALKYTTKNLWNVKLISYIGVAVLFYLNLNFAKTRAGFIAFIIAYVVFWALIFVKKILSKQLFLRSFLFFTGVFLICNFFFGIPLDNFYKFTLAGIQESYLAKSTQQHTTTAQPKPIQSTPPSQPQPLATSESNITDSGVIRLYVWRGAIDAWKANPLFGTGVETFAFAYYKFRPAGHNLTSEWDYLYNKAHNEYLNYLTTTGLFGLGTYLAFIGLFLLLFAKYLFFQKEQKITENQKQKNMSQTSDNNTKFYRIVTIALVSGYISILISNFFGFSVVIINVYLFLFPAFVLLLEDRLTNKSFSFGPFGNTDATNPYQWTLIGIFILCAGYVIIGLCRFWYADTKYALGYNLDRVGNYQQAYPLLLAAAQIEPREPVYKDELSINLAVLAGALFAQNDTTNGTQFANNAIALNDDVLATHSNDVIYWKNRVRLFYTLAHSGHSQQAADFPEALKAIQKAYELAPTDAKIAYNLGVLYGQTGDIPKGITVLQETIKLKPDYRDAYFALGLFYHQMAVDSKNHVINPELQQKAIETYQYILSHLFQKDAEAEKNLKEWQTQ